MKRTDFRPNNSSSSMTDKQREKIKKERNESKYKGKPSNEQMIIEDKNNINSNWTDKYITPFNDRGTLDNIKQNYSRDYELHKKALTDNSNLSQKEKDEIFVKIQSTSNGIGSRSQRLQGMRLDYTPILHRYIVIRKYGDIHEYYSPNKQCIRNYYGTNAQIREIHELKTR